MAYVILIYATSYGIKCNILLNFQLATCNIVFHI